MHFAYPPRKSSNPPPFRPRSSNFVPTLRRSRARTLVLILLGCLCCLWLLSSSRSRRTGGTYHESVPSGNPPVVIVTVVDPSTYNNAYLSTIKDNRELYAKKHGYEALVVKSFDFETDGAPRSWAQVMAARQAIAKYPDCAYIWLLDQHSYIMDPTRSLEDQVLHKKKLESLMIKDRPVVPPDSIIHTFAHLQARDVGLIVSQDSAGLNSGSIVIRNGDWAKFFLETWLDPLFRSYNFQKAERHGLEHIVQWHPTVLSRLALVPQQSLGSYTNGAPLADQGEAYILGDFVVMFNGCGVGGDQSCETQAQKYEQRWKEAFKKAGAMS